MVCPLCCGIKQEISVDKEHGGGPVQDSDLFPRSHLNALTIYHFLIFDASYVIIGYIKSVGGVVMTFLESIKESAEVSKRELILGVICGVLAGLVFGLLIGESRHKAPRAKKIIIRESNNPNKEDAIVLSPEDYD